MIKGGALDQVSVVDTVAGAAQSGLAVGFSFEPETSDVGIPPGQGSVESVQEAIANLSMQEGSIGTTSTRTMTTEMLEEIKREARADLNEHAIKLVKPLDVRKHI